MATTKRPVNLKFKNATKIINNTEQQFKEDATFDKDVDVTGDLAVTGSFTFAGPPPVWLAAPLTFLDAVTCNTTVDIVAGPLTLTGAAADIVVDLGDITATAGNITATAGNVIASTGDVLVPLGNVTVGTGNVAIATAGNFSSLSGDLDLTAGNVDITTGHVRVTTGNIQTTTGNVTVGTGNVAVTTGHLQTATGDIKVTTAGNISTLLGDITATNGDIYVTQGNLSVLNTVPGTDGNLYVGRTCELRPVAAAVAPVGPANSGTLTNDTGELIWRVGAVEQFVTRTGLSTVVGAVKTTDATPTDIVSVTVADEHMVSIRGMIHGWTNDAPDQVFVASIFGSAYRTGAGIAIIAANSVTELADTITAAVTVAVDGANAIVVHIVGAAKTTEWHCEIQVYDTTILA